MRITVITLVCAVFVLVAESHVLAQSFGTGGVGQITQSSLTFEPRFPEPESVVTVSLDAYSVDIVGSTIRWFQNGTEINNTVDQRTIEVTAPTLGNAVQLLAILSLRDGSVIRIERELRPSYVDVIIEADTHVPTFYQGRALASPGAQSRITIIPHFGQQYQADRLTYTWKLNNKVLFGGSARGRQTIEIEMPAARESFLTVDIADDSGKVIGQRTIILSPHDAEVYFYEDNPLRGISQNILPKEHILVGEEITVRAEPYFTNTFDTNVLEEWRVDGQTIDTTNADSRSLTLTAADGQVESVISYRIQNLTQFLQGARSDFVIRGNQ